MVVHENSHGQMTAAVSGHRKDIETLTAMNEDNVGREEFNRTAYTSVYVET
jgi:hypothetical protein